MKKTLTLIFGLSSLLVFCQSQELDSLRKALANHTQNDTVRFRLLISASDYLLSNPTENKALVEEALALAIELEFQKGIAEAYCSLTYYYFDRMDYAKAVDNGLLALRGYEKIHDAVGQYESYNVLAGIYTGWGDFEKAQEYMNVMEKLVSQNKGLVDEAAFYYTMGYFTLKQNKLETGANWIRKALSLYQQRDDKYQIASCFFLLAKSDEGLGKLNEAIASYQTSIAANGKSSHPNILSNSAASHEGLGRILIQQKKFEEANRHLDTAYQAALQIRSTNMILKIYADKAMLNEGLGNFRDALRYERLHKTLSDSLINKEKTKAVADAQAKYESEKQEQTIALLKQEKHFQTRFNYFLVSGITLLGIAAISIIFLQRSRARKTRELLDIQQSLNNKLLEIDRIKSSFFANISHEFRTPLTLIIGPIEENLKQSNITQKDKAAWQMMLRNAYRLLDLINQILELARLENGKLNLVQQRGNLEQFVAMLSSSFDSLAEMNRIEFVKEISIQKAELVFDHDKLEKIITNLLSNAFKFTPPKGKVILRAALEQTTLMLEIHDNGRGIAPENLKDIFNPFFQEGNTQTGTGLGLALVNELVKLHRGTIQVRSNINQGTSFFISLLLPQEGTATIGPATKHQPVVVETIASEPTEEPTHESSILVVDDNPDIRKFIKDKLINNFRVWEATDGEDGLEQAIEHMPNLIILDVMMPLRNGLELCQLLKGDQRTSHIPIIMLTARADQDSRLEGLKTGADDYLVKPFSSDELVARVENLVNQRKALIEKFKQKMSVQPHEVVVSSMDERFLKKAMDIVEAHMDDTQLGVEAFSEAMALSRTQLHRKLKALTGLSASEFIQDIRLRRAAQLILQKADSITQIAYQVGFNDQSYFSKCFKKKFLVAPSDYLG